MRLILSIGHSNTVGASGNGWEERQLVTKLLMPAFAVLQDMYEDVCLAPQDLDLNERIKWINTNFSRLDIAIDFHLNSAQIGTGSEIFYYATKYKEVHRANVLIDAFATSMQFRNRGSKPDNTSKVGRLAFCRDLTPHGFVLEMGFITNPRDVEQLIQKGTQAIVDMCASLDLKKIDMQNVYDTMPEWKKTAVKWAYNYEILDNPNETDETKIIMAEMLRKYDLSRNHRNYEKEK